MNSRGGSRLRRAVSRDFLGWVGPWLGDRARKAFTSRGTAARHLLLAVCDHFEPLHGGVARSVGLARVGSWRERLPEIVCRFHDSNGRSPRHTFFFPGEQYDPAFVEPLGELVDEGLAEVEVHLHHENDTDASLRNKLEDALDALRGHGLIAQRGEAMAWAFIHGNWSLANGRPDGRWCGVDDELELLHELGCYADFTFPSAPDPSQPSIVNSIYYARDPSRRRAYDQAERVRVGSRKRPTVLLIQGPLAIAAREHGRIPRIESAALSAGDPPSASRLATWITQWVHVDGRPEWTFVKLHSHGAPETNAHVLLGEPMAELHESLARLRTSHEWHVHYVTAREMYNVARAAMDGMVGSPASFFDYEIPPPERARRSSTSLLTPVGAHPIAAHP